ncbi:MAG: hypothetical protein JWN43_1679 [Gammaproteobacteria bacterium]|nr:hypothetical protein [Gammaproteobacteria bacterium]
MDPTICIREIERIVQAGPGYVGPHSEPLAHVYGVASVLRDQASTEIQREDLAAVISEFKVWFKRTDGNTHDGDPGASERVLAAIANLKRAFANEG